MRLSDAIGLEIERREKDADTGYCCPHCGSPTPNTELLARVEALEAEK